VNRRRRSGRAADSSRSQGTVDLRAWWGIADGGEPTDGGGDSPEPSAEIRPTPDPGAVPRSLGDPPLVARPGVAEAHLVAVYEEAVRAATALAAANGILAADASDENGF
jgi:hypothetical protein